MRHVPWWVVAAVTLPILVLTFAAYYSSLASLAAPIHAELAKVGVEPRGSSPEEGTVFLRAEFDKWKQVIADGKIKEN